MQLNAHQGMVRCGYCLHAFDARPNFTPDQPSPQLELLTDEPDAHEAQADTDDVKDTTSDTINLEMSATSNTESAEQTATPLTTDMAVHEPAIVLHETEPIPTEFEEKPDVAKIAAANFSATNTSVQPLAIPLNEPSKFVYFQDTPPLANKRRTWIWASGITFLTVLLITQSIYFFRSSLAAHLPDLKPALVQFCRLAACVVALPKNAELVSIESSGLEASPDHENEITFSALLRNRASYDLAFPMLALTLNDNQDKPLARRQFSPSDYLPADEHEQTGMRINHEVSIKLRLNTAELRPVGYRLELFYPK
jgi:hypothetical protein